ncbi:MAG: helix-turn-helix domain-containing protein [Clostridia bacterium]|nr:helix-turn-helix domain-containing protein [Clostridia bacterium]
MDDVLMNLPMVFDIAINDLGMDADEFAAKFAASDVAKGIEQGIPEYLCGHTGPELLGMILGERMTDKVIPTDCSPEYWAGWILAQLQWELDMPFMEIFRSFPMSLIIEMYNPYHEAPDSKAIQEIRQFVWPGNTLQLIRKSRNYSQSQLARISGVKLHTIQSYESGALDIKKASGNTLFCLAKTLCCSMEDLMR